MKNERFNLLLEKYLAQTLAPVERRELRSLLEKNPDLRAEYVATLTQATILRRIHRTSTTESARVDIRNISRARKGKKSSTLQVARRKPAHFSPWPFAAIAAAIMCAVIVKLAWSIPAKKTPGLDVVVVEPSKETVPQASDVPRVSDVPKVSDVAEIGDIIVESGKELSLHAEEYSGRKIITGASASALIRFKDETTIELKENTQIKLGLVDSKKGKEIEALVGRVAVHAAPQPQDRPLRMQSPHGIVTVAGTVFWLNVDTHGTSVNLLKGNVTIARTEDQAKLQLSAGQCAVLAPDIALTASPLKYVNGILLYREAFDAEFKNWNRAGAILERGATKDREPVKLALGKVTPPQNDQPVSISLDFGRALTRVPDSMVIDFKMRLLKPMEDKSWLTLKLDSNGANEKDSEDASTIKQRKKVLQRTTWTEFKLEVFRGTDANGNEMVRYRSYIGGELRLSKEVQGAAHGLQISMYNAPAEFTDLQVFELVP